MAVVVGVEDGFRGLEMGGEAAGGVEMGVLDGLPTKLVHAASSWRRAFVRLSRRDASEPISLTTDTLSMLIPRSSKYCARGRSARR